MLPSWMERKEKHKSERMKEKKTSFPLLLHSFLFNRLKNLQDITLILSQIKKQSSFFFLFFQTFIRYFTIKWIAQKTVSIKVGPSMKRKILFIVAVANNLSKIKGLCYKEVTKVTKPLKHRIWGNCFENMVCNKNVSCVI